MRQPWPLSLIPTQLLRLIPRTGPRALQPRRRLVLDVGTQKLLRRGAAPAQRRDVDAAKRQVRAGRGGAAVQGGSDVVAARARDVLPADAVDGEARGVAVGVAVDAGAEVDGLVDVLDAVAAEGDVADVAPLGRRVRLDPGGVGAVDAADVLEDDVVDVVDGVVAEGADGGAAALVAGDVADEDVGAVALDGDAVLVGGGSVWMLLGWLLSGKEKGSEREREGEGKGE